MRLNDVYYTDQLLDGNPKPEGPCIPVQFEQGDTVSFEVVLNYHNEPITEDRWSIEATIKTDQYALAPIWRGFLNDGVFKLADHAAGVYQILISNSTTAQWLAGTYWLDIRITENIRFQKGSKPISFSILKQPFSINYGASSPNPPKALRGVVFPEITVPLPTDISRY